MHTSKRQLQSINIIIKTQHLKVGAKQTKNLFRANHNDECNAGCGSHM